MSAESTEPQTAGGAVAPGPNWRDWALLAVNLAFVATGVLILPGKFDVGMVTIVLFGFCSLVPVTTILRKRRGQRTRPLRVGVVGGVRIRPSRFRAGVLGGGLCALGTMLIVFGEGYPPLFRALSWFIATVGAVFGVLVLWGKVPVGYVMFTPQGLTIGQRKFAMTVAWDDLVAWDCAEFNDNPLLRLWLRPGAGPSVEPPELAPQAQRHLATSEAWLGAPVTLMTSMYALDLPLVIQAIERYVLEPASRAELECSRVLSR